MIEKEIKLGASIHPSREVRAARSRPEVRERSRRPPRDSSAAFRL